MNIQIIKYVSAFVGKLTYIKSEHSFSMEGTDSGDASVLVNDVNMELNGNGRVVSLWGYSPMANWKTCAVKPPPSSINDHALVFIDKLIPGTSKRINSDKTWPVYYDSASGWVCFSGLTVGEVDTVIQFLPNCYAAFVDNSLIAIWLKPEFLP